VRGSDANRDARAGGVPATVIAFVFPGQGSQNPGMGLPWVDSCPDLFDVASRAAGKDVRRLTCEADEAELRSTENAQMATAVCSLAALRALREGGVRPAVVAGHSLGEYPALVAAGALDEEAALRLVAVRGAAMAEAAAGTPGTMAAILGADEDMAAAACQKAPGTVVVANVNSAEQVVISGTEDAVQAACDAALALGAKRAMPLRVGGAFHSPLMAAALVDLAQAIAATSFSDASIPVVCNVDARPHTAAAELVPLLVAQVCAPVRWSGTMQTLSALDVTAVIEVGQGGVLKKLAQRHFKGADPECSVAAVTGPADVADLGGAGDR